MYFHLKRFCIINCHRLLIWCAFLCKNRLLSDKQVYGLHQPPATSTLFHFVFALNMCSFHMSLNWMWTFFSVYMPVLFRLTFVIYHNQRHGVGLNTAEMSYLIFCQLTVILSRKAQTLKSDIQISWSPKDKDKFGNLKCSAKL